jgi:uncharacterized membrane protein HdeD (DUF308 family)
MSHLSNANFIDLARSNFRAGLAEISGKWGWYLALGLFLIVLGWIATGMAVATTLISVTVLGWILILAGAGLIVMSFLTANWGGFLLSLAAGALSFIAGIAILNSPVEGAVAVSLMFGAILVAVGIFRSIASIVTQFPKWGWALLSGIASIVLGVMLLGNWQNSTLWFVGLYIGIDLIIHGFSWVMFATGLHSAAKNLGITERDRRAA